METNGDIMPDDYFVDLKCNTGSHWKLPASWLLLFHCPLINTDQQHTDIFAWKIIVIMKKVLRNHFPHSAVEKFFPFNIELYINP